MNLKKTYWKFWIWIPILIISSLLYTSVINVYVYVDVYSFTLLPMAIYISVFLLISGYGYYLNRHKEMLENLTISHIRLTVIGSVTCFSIAILLLIKNGQMTSAATLEDFTSFSLDQFLALSFVFGLLLVFVGFIVYISNTAISTFYMD